MDRVLGRLPAPAWVAGAFVLGIVIGLGLTWLALGAFATTTVQREAVPGHFGPRVHAPYGPGAHH